MGASQNTSIFVHITLVTYIKIIIINIFKEKSKDDLSHDKLWLRSLAGCTMIGYALSIFL